MQNETIKLQDSEIKIMNVLWRKGDLSAKEIAEMLAEEIGWNKNTTYTLIKRCIKKGAIERREPNFVCHAIVSQKDVQERETKELVDKIFDGSVDKLFASLLGKRELTAKQLDKLKQVVEELK